MVGLGPAGPELTTGPVVDALARCQSAFVRTRRHPAASCLGGQVTSFDPLYDRASSMEEVYRGIVEALVEAAGAIEAGRGPGGIGGPGPAGPGPVGPGLGVVYAVPGSPTVLETSVALLRADRRVSVELIAGMSFLDLAWARLAVDPVAAGVRLVDGEAFGVAAAGERGPLLVAQCWSREVMSGIKLAVEEYPEAPVTVLSHLGLADEAIYDIAWADLDRALEPDHLTSLWIPELAAPVGAELARLLELVRTLRQRCPWDREQTHASLSRHLIEEAYEVVEAIDGLRTGGSFAHLEEELGDLLLQICFHALLAAEAGQFNLADVATTVHDKLVGRHPHVFARVPLDGAEQVLSNWEQIKRAEKGRSSVMDGIPVALPALLAASKVLGKAAAVGADRSDLGVALAALRRAVGKLEAGEPQVGMALLSLVGVSRALGVDAEGALRQAVADYRSNFEALARDNPGR